MQAIAFGSHVSCRKKIHQSASKSAPCGQGAASSEGVLVESRGKLQREGKTHKAVPDVRLCDFFFRVLGNKDT